MGVENMKEKRIKNKISSLGYFQVELKEKKCLYKEKKMHKKIEKSSKICLCMIKKTSSPPPHKKSPKKQNRPKQQSKKRKGMKKKIQNNQRRILKSLFDFQNGKEKKRIKTKIRSQDYETFFCLSKHFVSHLAYKKSMPNIKKK